MKKKVTMLEYKKLKPVTGGNPTPFEWLIFGAIIVAVIVIIIWYSYKISTL